MTARTVPVPASEFHLFNEAGFDFDHPGGASVTDAAAPSSAAPLIIAGGPVSLQLADNGVPQLLPVSANTLEPAPRFEVITGRDARLRLLVVSDAARPARVNGLRAPRLALLASGDRLRFDGTASFRVAIYHRPRLGPVPTELIGIQCPVCTIPLAEGDRCLVCPCGSPFHAALDESAEGALACAQMAKDCAHCLAPLRLQPSYETSADPAHE